MRLSLVIFLLCLAEAMFAQTGMAKTTTVYSEDGKLQMLIVYDPACPCRTYTEYYPDGKIFAKRVFKVTDKGEFVHGEDLSYYHDGSIKTYKLWEYAVPEGRAYSNYENGKLEHEEFYNNRQKTGSWKYFSSNGELLREYLYEGYSNAWNSKADNVTVRHYNSGRLAYTEIYKKGKLIQSDRRVVSTKGVTVAAGRDSSITDGKKLFEMKCAVCHSFDKDGYGPSLGNVIQRRSVPWLRQMIYNGMKLVEDGDKTALALYNKYGKKKHLNFEYLTAKQVQAIIDFLKKDGK